MQQLTEALFYGVWRSYKVFLQTGEVKNHTKYTYLEFAFKENKQLVITAYDNGNAEKLEESNDWTILFKDKRHYISITGKGVEYEVITINHVALVVLHMKTKEKFFCALPQTWDTYIRTPASAAL